MAENKNIGDGRRTDPAKVAQLIIELAKSHGWQIAASGIDMICSEAGLEEYTVSLNGRAGGGGVTLPDRPYTVTKVGNLTEIKSE